MATAMAATLQVMHSSASLHRQQAPSTAPVLEFACLFTRDLRRKQKRWHDGRLKYHTFNKRIMVYDDHGNFVGDAHWCEDYDLNDGDEVELERGGVTVQVSECIGSRDQDLSELVDKRAQEKAERQAAVLARRQLAPESAAIPQTATPHFQLRHKPLHHLIGTPTGHHGRALMPTESPYEDRLKKNVSPQDSTTHPVKRRKREVSPPSKGGYAQSLFGAALTLSGTPTSTPPLRSRPLKASPDPGPNNKDLNSALILARTTATATATAVQKERLVHAPGAALSSKISRVPEALVQDMNDLQSSPLPIKSVTGPHQQHGFTHSIERRLGLKRKGETRSLVVEDDSQYPVSVKLNTASLSHDQLNHAQPKGRCDVLDDVISVTSPRSQKFGYTSLVSKSKTSVQSQGLFTAPKLGNVPKAIGCDQEQAMSEPRTELRIKPRKKRGLLMISENLETRNRSSLGRVKSRIDRHDPSTSLADKTNNSIPNRDGSSDIENREDDHLRQQEENALRPIGSIHKSPSSIVNPDSNGPSSAASHNCNMVDSEEVSDIRSPILGEKSGRHEMASHSRYDEKNDRHTTMLEPTHERVVLADTTISPKRRRQSSGEKIAPAENNINHSMVERYDGRRATPDEDDLPGSVPAPRLVRLGRKSIRSREVIGLIFDDENINDYGGLPRKVDEGKCGKGSLTCNMSANHMEVQATKSETSRIDMTMADDNRIGINNQCQDYYPIKGKEVVEACTIPRSSHYKNTDAVDVEASSKFLRKQARLGMVQTSASLDTQAHVLGNTTAVSRRSLRIVANPATRGKKAAKPSDAAGQVPQCPLPSEAVVVGNPSISAKQGDDRRRPRAETRTKEAANASMSGFARANGGPWSREAHDLFGFTRPP
ncbi:uncharacterized protein GGS22DRAFT_159772 [Annulohypoxylon maeteangense]|uniref:uncharacterized protein n=1 Tax=Annulohypoxylon maeteangense TaxID=1927788 RepID=UPI002007B545|nr:uncharacterized protein GGS22DRAFT_159772 [Annulohypoxylon maeteangense]KAI0886067.1 hypothetical protein GGS22DRAFT_159772 [Annulohypoxylon maeteangense]